MTTFNISYTTGASAGRAGQVSLLFIYFLMAAILPCSTIAFLSASLSTGNFLPSSIKINTSRSLVYGTTIDNENNDVPVLPSTKRKEVVDICIIGAGISGLSAALTCAKLKQNDPKSTTNKVSISIIEGQNKPGGRVTSDYTNDGFILDKGFAVFVDTYPQSKQIFDYESLKLSKFQPGALIRTQQNKFATVADPIRQPSKLFTALLSPVGTFKDKIRLLPLFYKVKTKSIEELFMDDEMDTLSCLQSRYKFTDKFIKEFFTPFLEGIYFSPLDQQSSRMFEFVFKMFADGAATLPTGGMQAVSDQLAERVLDFGVVMNMNQVVKKIYKDEKRGGFVIHTSSGNSNDDDDDTIHAQRIICATEYASAHTLLSTIEHDDFSTTNNNFHRQPQRSVGCIYYSFQGDAPIKDKILILNSRENDGPINTLCFPSVVNDSYAPKGYNLCSVSITESTVDKYKARDDDLDIKVREQLAEWFEDFRDDILYSWEKKGDIYKIMDAQPSQNGSFPANIHGGRDCTEFEGMKLPNGLFICGDHMVR